MCRELELIIRVFAGDENLKVTMSDLTVSDGEAGRRIEAILEDGDLWQKFHQLTNEMIVTKSGRRMFPLIKVRISGLEPKAFYSILLEFKQVDNNRWKYINGEWLPGNGMAFFYILLPSLSLKYSILHNFYAIFQLNVR